MGLGVFSINKILKSLILAVISFQIISLIYAEGISKGKALGKAAGSPAKAKFNINNVSTYFSNDGDSDLDPVKHSGFIFPKGSGKAVFYESGFIWGAKIDDQIRVGGSTYNHGIIGGKILNSDLPANQLIAEDNDAANVRIYRVRRDYKTGSLALEAIDESKTVDQIYAQYEKDWNEWPAVDGAPYEDVNLNGSYDPSIDIPGIPGADQTLWFVSNDLDSSSVQGLYGSLPMGVEVQTTIWGYNQAGPLGNMLFRKYLLINKSSKAFEDTYVAMWSDPDLGDATDDFAGCDTTLSLGYIYNSTASDGVYSDGRIPAAGFDFFQGPLVQGEEGDTAIFKNAKVAGMKNLPMTAFFYFINSDDVYSDPPLGNYQGSVEMYNLLQGKLGPTGNYYPIPDGGVTTLPLSGDPVTGSGYIDGILYEPGDRRFGMASGPFTMAAGDTQEVVVAQIAAQGENNIASVNLLKYYDKTAQSLYNNGFKKEIIPMVPDLNISDNGTSIILDWSGNSGIVESFNSEGFKFQGYNVYQIGVENSIQTEKKKLATFDIVDGITTIYEEEFNSETGTYSQVAKQQGSDSGIERTFEVNFDYTNSGKLIKGKSYYFAVTAYTYNDTAGTRNNNTETLPDWQEIKFRYDEEGPNYLDVVNVVQIAGGQTDEKIIVKVVDPDLLTDDTYQFSFNLIEDNRYWTLKDITTNETVFDQRSFSSTTPSISDGFSILFSKVAPVKSCYVTGEPWVSGINRGGTVFNGGIFAGYDAYGSSIGLIQQKNVELRWAGADSWSTGALSDSSSESLMAESKNEYPDRWSTGGIYRRNLGFDYFGLGDLPVSAWDISGNTPRRLNLLFVENDAAINGANNIWDMGWNDLNGTFQFNNEFSATEFLYVMNSDYNESADYNKENSPRNGDSDLLYVLYLEGKNNYLQNTLEMQIIKSDFISDEEIFEFKSKDITTGAISNENRKMDYSIKQNYPNPFNPSTVIEFTLQQNSNVQLEVYNILGQKVKELVNRELTAGTHSVRFNGSNLASGIYFYRIKAGKFSETKKMMLLK